MMSMTTLNGTGSVQSGDDGGMDSSHPRADGPSRRRSFTPAQKLEHLAEYEAACQTHEGGAYLRREGCTPPHDRVAQAARRGGAGRQEPGEKVGRQDRPPGHKGDVIGVGHLRHRLSGRMLHAHQSSRAWTPLG